MKPGAGRLLVRLRRVDGHLVPAVVAPDRPDPSALFAGRRAEEVAALVPLVWNVCAAAQGVAASSALGLAPPPGAAGRAAAETLREHVLRLAVALPEALGLKPAPEPCRLAHLAGAGDREAARHLAGVLFAPLDRAPEDMDDLAVILSAKRTVAARALALVADWPPDWGRVDLPPPAPATEGTRPCAAENTTAARLEGAPLLAAVAAAHGRGPLWRLAARLAETGRLLSDLAEGRPARDPLVAPGVALAARGPMVIEADVVDGRVRRFARRSPTCDALVTGGLLERALATLPGDLCEAFTAGLVCAMVAVVDPCMPVTVEAADA